MPKSISKSKDRHYKLLEENINRIWFNIYYSKFLVHPYLRIMKNKLPEKGIKLKSIWIPKEIKNKTLRTGKNICKWRYPQGIHLQNIQIAPATQYQKYIHHEKKWDELWMKTESSNDRMKTE